MRNSISVPGSLCIALLVGCAGHPSAPGTKVPTTLSVSLGPTDGANAGVGVGHTSGRFAVVGNLANPRAGHTATLLPDGTVLIAGASDLQVGSDLLISNPNAETVSASGQTTATVHLTTSREFHTATLLQTGKVLIAGGNEYYPSTATAELYDPASKQSTATGSMSTARTGHTASLLPDGRVLIVGGALSELGSAEIYDPSKGTFGPASSPLSARTGHTATVLASGKILFAGGQGPSGTLATAEVYDPATSTFKAVGSMSEPRAHHTATLLPNGKVLVTGGIVYSNLYAQSYSQIVQYFPQVVVGATPSVTAELFDPQTETFTAIGSMTTARASHTATLLPDGTVLLCGGLLGYSNEFDSDNTAEIYDPATGSFKSAGTMNSGKFWHTATLLPDGTVMLAGGINSDWTLNLIETFR